MYNKEELGFILYNNRSVKGVVNNFLPKDINSFKLIDLENRFSKIKEDYFTNKMVEVDMSELDIEEPDEIVTPYQLKEISDDIKHNIGLFNPIEYEYLLNRGIGDKIIKKYSLLGLSSIKDREILRRIGATCHPVLKKFLVDGIEGGGIVFPLFKDGILMNCSIRKLSIENSDQKTLKYSLACPDLPVWGLEDIKEGDEVWITEGIFDMIALREMGKKSVTCSSGMWSGLQLYQLIEKKPSMIVIISDDDEVGFRTGAMLKELFTTYRIESKILVSSFAKDPAEHYFQKNKSISDFKEIDITKDMVISKNDNSFNFINHLKNRNF